MLKSTAVFSYNSKVKYRAGGVYPNTGIRASTLTHPTIMVDSKSIQFTVKYPDIFENYKVKIANVSEISNWTNNPMQFWQNQLHFALWCATTGCGISFKDHLSTHGLTKSLYLFHVYYQTRRILKVMQTPLPPDASWNANNNPYNRREYEHICNEFGVPTNTDWRWHGQNNGMGYIFVHVYDFFHKNPNKTGYINDTYDPSKFTFSQPPPPSKPKFHMADVIAMRYGPNPFKKHSKPTSHAPAVTQVVYIEQIAENWQTFVLDKSEGFTKAGVERINDSIRTYVWAMVGAQAQTRTDIVGVGTAFDAQKQFLANVEDAISSPVDLPSAIKRYQDVLRYAGSKVDFVFGIGLYMAPSNMRLKVVQIAGYNNEIVIATDKQTLGINSDVNSSVIPQPKEVGIVKPQSPRIIKPSKPHLHPDVVSQNNQHVDEKTALVVGGVAVGLLMIWFST